MTFWDFISNQSYKTKIIFLSILSLIPIGGLILYKYIDNIDKLSWYFTLLLIIGTMGIYYILYAYYNWVFIDFLNFIYKDTININEKYKIIGISSFIEIIIFTGAAYLFIDNAKLFWILLFGLQLYRIPIINLAKYLAKKFYKPIN